MVLGKVKVIIAILRHVNALVDIAPKGQQGLACIKGM
jgi:hypothetical protein